MITECVRCRVACLLVFEVRFGATHYLLQPSFVPESKEKKETKSKIKKKDVAAKQAPKEVS